mmetsp:Transcript_4924/g.12766  ORF Transcript_4924/g.12766 Transcript_4924/m.12766 type:complete len:250 (-) Transcript_4924:834-1583(-)
MQCAAYEMTTCESELTCSATSGKMSLNCSLVRLFRKRVMYFSASALSTGSLFKSSSCRSGKMVDPKKSIGSITSDVSVTPLPVTAALIASDDTRKIAASFCFHEPTGSASAAASSSSMWAVKIPITSVSKDRHRPRTRSVAPRRRVSASAPSWSRRMYSCGLSSKSSSSTSRNFMLGTITCSQMARSVSADPNVSACAGRLAMCARNFIATATSVSNLTSSVVCVSRVHVASTKASMYSSLNSSSYLVA